MIPLKHYGKCEVLGKIANMEPLYDEPMHFDPDLLPATSVAAGSPRPVGLWDQGSLGHPRSMQSRLPHWKLGCMGSKERKSCWV